MYDCRCICLFWRQRYICYRCSSVYDICSNIRSYSLPGYYPSGDEGLLLHLWVRWNVDSLYHCLYDTACWWVSLLSITVFVWAQCYGRSTNKSREKMVTLATKTSLQLLFSVLVCFHWLAYILFTLFLLAANILFIFGYCHHAKRLHFTDTAVKNLIHCFVTHFCFLYAKYCRSLFCIPITHACWMCILNLITPGYIYIQTVLHYLELS